MGKKEVTKEKALERMAGLCSRSEQCEHDILRKLFNLGIKREDREFIISYLRENRYIDDDRFARSFVNDKARFAHWGPGKIRLELSRRKVSRESIKQALESVGQEVWKEGLLKNAESKSKNLDLTGETGYENRQKLFRYLLSRGFSSSNAGKATELMKRRQQEQG